MDEGNKRKMRKYLGLVTRLVVGVAISSSALANSLTVRDIKLLGQGKIEIQLDGAPTKGALDIEFVRDIVQFSIQNATIYPAKILHSGEDDAAFSKVFAYQYAPNLVRVRFSVEGRADQFQGKVKWKQEGKLLTVSFPEGIAKAAPKKETESKHEQSLLAKVLGQSKEDVKVEKIEDAQVVSPKKSEAAKAEAKADARAEAKAETVKAEAAKEDPSKMSDYEKAEAQPIFKTDKRKGTTEVRLGGAPKGPSPIRSFLAMLCVVGGLGIVLLYVKKKKGSAQAKKVGDSWISNLLSGSKKPKALIEIVANHPLGPKQSITVVRIRGQQLVLGVTEGNVQLITQLDSDDEIDVMDDPKVADSIGKMFGGKPTVERVAPQAKAPVRTPAPQAIEADSSASFGNLLKNSSGAGAIVARNAYQSQSGTNPAPRPNVSAPNLASNSNNAPSLQSSVRDGIKQRLQGMRN
jgi:flagellar biogenesis protein FliO